MSTETSILLLWLVLLQEGAAIRPAVTFTPDYKKIFTSEQITMTCDVGSTIGEGMDYIWYRDRDYTSTQVYYGKSIVASHSGYYRCQSRPGEISDPARLEVSNGWLILQTPLYVYEGDDIYIRCHHRPGYDGGGTRFYKDNTVIRDWRDNAEYYISNVTKTTAGTFRCTKGVYYNGRYNPYEDAVSVSVQDLFTTPTISVTPQPVITTDKMSLTCQTSLPPPPRHNTQLRIAFYREGGIVQGFGVSDTYEVYNVQLEDSGKYSCEVETTDGRVRKRSAETIIQIGEIFSHPIITVTNNVVTEGDPMALTCDTTLSLYRATTRLEFAFYRDGWKVQDSSPSNKYEVQSAQLEDSGNYTCNVKTMISSTMKLSDGYNIRVQELFSPPVLKVSPELVNDGDIITLICDTNLTEPRWSTELQYVFYRDGERVQGFSSDNKYEVQFIPEEHSGTYTCEIQTPNSKIKKRSQDLHVQDLFSTPTISVTPQPVITTDKMALTCQTSLPPPPRHNTQLRIAFYREGGIVQGFGVSDTYEVYNVQLEDSGKYSCEVETTDGRVRKRSAETIIQIGEIFSHPIITLTNNVVTEGDPMTLTCDTTLSPYRPTTRLEFSFYRDGWKVQDFSPSNKYEVQSAQLEDSGNYTCHVRTSISSTMKISDGHNIWVQELFSYPSINVMDELFEGDPMALTCDTTLSPYRPTTRLEFAFYRDGRKVQDSSPSNKYEVQSAQLEDSGNYTCQVQSLMNPTMKKSNESYISVTELFSPPVLKMSPKSINKGDKMILTCGTNLTEPRRSTELQYVFYRDGRNVQGFSSDNKYEVQFIQEEHSGTYTCEIQTPNSKIKKMSQNLHVQGSMDCVINTILSGGLGLSLFINIITCFFLCKRRSSSNKRHPKTAASNTCFTEGKMKDMD
ncbi:Fc receptor-like protein 5 [Leptodactylus fuscus]|uniref:Fc receptor-like protein 5 n=1 Tax=Leptodactylus fuscus TaxID=238119 RepID=UPI003F4F0D22